MNLKHHQIGDNMLGSGYMLLAMASFAIGDSFMKFISSELPLGQLLFTRGLFATTILFLIAYRLGHLRPLATIFKAPFIASCTG